MKALQNRASEAEELRSLLPTIGSRSEFTRSPSRESIAGSRVSAAATETTPTMIAPAARLRRTFVRTTKQAEEGDDERAAAEEHGTTGCRSGPLDRRLVVEAPGALLSQSAR